MNKMIIEYKSGRREVRFGVWCPSDSAMIIAGGGVTSVTVMVGEVRVYTLYGGVK
jgi:hypothetical protein